MLLVEAFFATDMEYTSSPKPQLSSRANAFSIAALMSSGKPNKEKETEENTIKPLGKDGKCVILIIKKTGFSSTGL